MSTVSTHVLDSTYGVPAAALAITLFDPEGRQMTAARTDADGRVSFDLELGEGTHVLHFDTGGYFLAAQRDTFYPEVAVSFAVDPEQSHLHVALLLGPYSYTTYKGS